MHLKVAIATVDCTQRAARAARHELAGNVSTLTRDSDEQVTGNSDEMGKDTSAPKDSSKTEQVKLVTGR